MAATLTSTSTRTAISYRCIITLIPTVDHEERSSARALVRPDALADAHACRMGRSATPESVVGRSDFVDGRRASIRGGSRGPMTALARSAARRRRDSEARSPGGLSAWRCTPESRFEGPGRVCSRLVCTMSHSCGRAQGSRRVARASPRRPVHAPACAEMPTLGRRPEARSPRGLSAWRCTLGSSGPSAATSLLLFGDFAATRTPTRGDQEPVIRIALHSRVMTRSEETAAVEAGGRGGRPALHFHRPRTPSVAMSRSPATTLPNPAVTLSTSTLTLGSQPALTRRRSTR